ncbi:MAG: transporter [Verrucomicrobia bacterium]|nr:transporter [Verrucomicrobiota bacterium]
MSEPALAPRRWWYVMPVVFITYSLAYLDRANYGFAAAAGMARELNIGKGMFSLIGSLFFLGYFFFQIPGAIYAQRHSVRKLVFVSLILWGAAATLTGLVTGVGALLAVRFALGIVEAAVLPAMIIYLGNWFSRSERSRANTLLILGNPVTILWMSIASGYLIRSFGWRGMFIIEGAPAILWAFAWWMLASETPNDARWLTAAEKAALAGRLAQEQAGLKTFGTYLETFRSREVVLLCVQYFSWSLGVYGFVLWLPSIVKEGSAAGIVATGWLSAVPFVVAIVAMLVSSFFSDRRAHRIGFIWPSLLVGAAAFVALYGVGASNFWWSFALLTIAGAAMYAPFGPFFALIPEMFSKQVAGGAVALINSMGALGSFVGSYAVGYLNDATGSPESSYLLMAGALFVAVIMTLLVGRRPGGRSGGGGGGAGRGPGRGRTSNFQRSTSNLEWTAVSPRASERGLSSSPF